MLLLLSQAQRISSQVGIPTNTAQNAATSSFLSTLGNPSHMNRLLEAGPVGGLHSTTSAHHHHHHQNTTNASLPPTAQAPAIFSTTNGGFGNTQQSNFQIHPLPMPSLSLMSSSSGENSELMRHHQQQQQHQQVYPPNFTKVTSIPESKLFQTTGMGM